MYPHERSLVQRLANEPFALIGVNSDKDRDTLKKVIANENLTWRSFWNGGSTRGPISTAWGINGWPTIYVIDAKGVIRFMSRGPDQAGTEKAIQEALAQIKASAGR